MASLEETNEDTFTVENLRTYLAALLEIQKKINVIFKANQAEVASLQNAYDGASYAISKILQKHKDLKASGATVPTPEAEQLRTTIIGFNRLQALLADRKHKGQHYATFQELLADAKLLLGPALEMCLAGSKMGGLG